MHLLKVTICSLLWVVVIEEEIGVLGAAGLRLQEIDGLQPKALGQLQDRFVAGVDQLAAPLTGLSIDLPGCVGVHASSYTRRCLENSGAIPGIL